VSTKLYFTKTWHNTGNFDERIQTYLRRHMIKIIEVRIIIHCKYRRYKLSEFRIYLRNPKCLLKRLYTYAGKKRKCYRYKPDILVGKRQFFNIKGLNLKNMIYTITVVGYKIIN